ncbi:hypothetical protein K1719_009894 [Acacia pycnantha]|nr:hypothetical protein K1719_009894 [Acacia pycnantha]
MQSGLNEEKSHLAKDKGPLKKEWVQVGLKRKSSNKGKWKDQAGTNDENPRCNMASSHLGHRDAVGLEDGNNVGLANEGCVLMEVNSGVHNNVVIQVSNSDEPIGTGAKSFPALVRDLKAHYQLNFIAILETRCSMDISQQRASNLGFLHMKLIECEGYSGGIWCLWDHSITSITLLERHRQFIHLQVTGAAGTSWTITVVYASTSSASRRILWENLSHLSVSIQGAWLVGGDFNGTLLFCERRSLATFCSSID